MAKKLGPDGVPVNIPTVHGGEAKFIKEKTKDASEGGRDGPQENPKKRRKGRSLFPEDPVTQIATRSKEKDNGPAPGYRQASDSPQTVIAGGSAQRNAPRQVDAPPRDPSRGLADPVVGWLVVTDGPGKGFAVRLGNGQNSIGRGETSRVRMDFGDEQISRSDHAVVIYDPKQNRFYIRQGQGVNLVYLDDQPVLSPTPLSDGSRITLGETTLRFVALCNDDFRWTEQQQSTS